MEYTEEQKRDFQERFAALRKRQLLATIPILVLVVILAFADEGAGAAFGVPATIWGPIAIVYVVGLVVFSLRNWRCPACQKYLGRGFGPRFCPRCGVQLKGV